MLSLVANQMNCTVTLVAGDGVEHSVEVTTGSVYEAAIRGVRELKVSDWSREDTYDATNLKIAAKAPTVVHTVNLPKLKPWLARPAGSPREVAMRSRLKELMQQ